MSRLEEIQPECIVKGIIPGSTVAVVSVKNIGPDILNVFVKDSNGKTDQRLLYRSDEPHIEIIAAGGSPWSFNSDPSLFKVVAEARRIRLAHLFDPMLAVHTSLIEPFPHQITAVYEEMIPRQPLRYLLADDPGAGKTIMAGLLIKELMARGDLEKCLVVCPGNLVEQWQDELDRKFNLPFEIMTNDKYEAARTGNWFTENRLVVCRLDKLSRNEDVQEKLKAVDWDLIICDEAHKMSAGYYGRKIKKTKRYKLGEVLSGITRHFLLMTATPHNGKDIDFQLFLRLLDRDRFEGKLGDGAPVVDTSDLMRRLLKENLLTFEGKPLFPERHAYTVNYTLSDEEAALYEQVTAYVREEFNRAEALINAGRKGTVGFALTILQRRLASSPEAIYQSLKRRKEKLEKRMREEELIQRGELVRRKLDDGLKYLSAEDLEDLEDAPDEEVEDKEEQLVDLASAAQTIEEFKAEIKTLKRLENIANTVRYSGTDRKWDQLSSILQDNSEMFDANGRRRKLIIFTEHRDTLRYLTNKIRGVLGQEEAVVTIQGGMSREQRKNAESRFTQDRDVSVLVATDAAGEGINLQRAHLMVNYDLPWNPNRLEQRFGRIHRIGQTEICYLWNLVAKETREGDVYTRLLEKLAAEKEALGGQVYDVLGRVTFDDKPLRDLLMQAILEGNSPEAREKMYRVVDRSVDHAHIQELLEERAIATNSMDFSQIMKIREEMERADARRLQPHFIASFFLNGFEHLNGTFYERERKRYEITRVPPALIQKDRVLGTRDALLTKYERICFDKGLVTVPGKPLATFVSPGHPLLDVLTYTILEKNQDVLSQGTVLVDENDPSDVIRFMAILEHAVHDARKTDSGSSHVLSRRMQFVEFGKDGSIRSGGYAPYLDYRPLTSEEEALWHNQGACTAVGDDYENHVMEYAATHLVPEHLHEVKTQREKLIDKTMLAVKDRLTQEINHWAHRANWLKEQESVGKINALMNSENARRRAEELTERLEIRMNDLEAGRSIFPGSPVIVGGAAIIPAGLLAQLKGEGEQHALFAKNTKEMELRAMQAVMDAERRLGFVPTDVSALKCGYDIESAIPGTGRLRFIEVKGRVSDAETVTVSRNEILVGLNKPEDFILAVVLVDGDSARVHYLKEPFEHEPDRNVNSINFNLKKLLAKAVEPA